MKLILTLSLFLFSFVAVSQSERKFIREGNTKFDENNYSDSEVSYRKALENQPESFPAKFNLGNSLFFQKKYGDAIDHYNSIVADATTPKEKGEVLFNLGNSHLHYAETLHKDSNDVQKSQEMLKESIEAYKKVLRMNPQNSDARYNMVYAKKKLLEMQKQQQENGDDGDNQDENNENGEDSEDNQENKDNKNQNKESQGKDSDGDGIPDDVEKGDDKNNPDDTDKDGKPDYQDEDADNDGKPDKQEAGSDPNKPKDTDKDGTPDYQDTDSDGDGIPDSEEADVHEQKISEEDAKRLLEALENDELKIQDRLQKQKAKSKNAKIDKDW